MSKPVTPLPPAFEKQMSDMLGGEYNSFRASLETSPPVSIRINPLKTSPVSTGEVVQWCPSGRYLKTRPAFTLDPHFHSGAYYVQEASSMFLEQAVRQSMDLTQQITALDLCAAPGGKSTHLLAMLNKESLLVSNETIRSRASILSENIQKWGYSNVMVTNNDPSAFGAVAGSFDSIVIDAPCSGEGMFRKDPAAVAEWSPDSVAMCSSRQRRIVEDVWPALKTNGILIYCTCTYNESENESNLEWLSNKHDLEFLNIDVQTTSIQEIKRNKAIGYRFFPHQTAGEGFFISVMRKLEPVAEAAKARINKQKSKAVQWLNGDYVTIQRGDLSIAVPEACSSRMDFFAQHLNVVIQGVALGATKHGKFIPDHALALSTDVNKNEFPILELAREDALRYLRKDTLNLPPSTKGMALIQFEGNAIGWANVLDTRINNLYPSNWRIKNL
jgi:16S rRNA C967 or C1407 C5-methylase (RsmB/RsmF family)/NOL1/NOP2/fmu family ribosome biogenesis protein